MPWPPPARSRRRDGPPALAPRGLGDHRRGGGCAAADGATAFPVLQNEPKSQSRAGPFGVKIAQAAAGRRSDKPAIRQRRWRRVNNRKSFSFLSEFAGVRITHGHQKEARRSFPGATVARSGEGRLRRIKNNNRPARRCTYVFQTDVRATL